MNPIILMWYLVPAVPWVSGDKNLKEATSTEPPFHFLVQGEQSYIANKLVTETVEYQVEFNFSVAAWNQVVTDLNERFRKFENLGFFSDSELKGEFLSYTSLGFYGLSKAETLGNYIMKYKNENKPHLAATCVQTLLTWNLDEMSRFRVNLDYRFSYINVNWEVSFVKSNTEAQETLLSWIQTFNEGGTELFHTARQLVETLELLNDGIVPSYLLGENKTCKNEGSSLEGEIFHILNCNGHKEGFSCMVQITQPVEFTSVYLMEKVVYDHMELEGRYVLNTQSKGIMRLECEELPLAHPACEVYVIPPPCRHGLEENHIDQIIESCNFTEVLNPPTHAILAKGGVLVQQGVETVQAGGQVISDDLPLLLYSTGKISLTKNRIDIGIYPEVLATTNTVVKSAVTESQLTRLRERLNWDEWKAELDSEEVTDLTLILWELVTLPFIMYGFIKSCRSTRVKSSGHEKVDKRRIYKQNMSLLRKE